MIDSTHIHATSKGPVDPVGLDLQRRAEHFLGIETGRVLTSHVYSVVPALPETLLNESTCNAFSDPILSTIGTGPLSPPPGYASHITVDKHAGVTDDEGKTAWTVLHDLFPGRLDRSSVRSRVVYWIESVLPPSELRALAEELIGNPLVHRLGYGPARVYEHAAGEEIGAERAVIESISLAVDDEALREISVNRLLALDLREMRAIQSYFLNPDTVDARRALGAPPDATDCELEILAQTWSEHCKHKEFNARIEFVDHESNRRFEIDSLFLTYIKGATQAVADRLASWRQDWLVKVFDDNAGVVRIDEDRLFVWKVETHNSPSALDPYGGAITGILGNNRDPLGTGRGGGRLLFNTNVLCFGPPDYDRPLLPGQLHPRRVFAGVRKGIEDGGNKSGIPTVNGAIVFDDRYAGKPLVFCGTGSVAPAAIDGQPWWEKRIDPGDRIVMVGGRVGKDGIHGATFSSEKLDEGSPRSAVQIGSPYTQKLLSDFLEDAALRGLVKCATDNGAGGLSSSIGELARIPGGAEVTLDQVPLKYKAIQPWEIFLSESQERMTLVVEPDRLAPLLELAGVYDVEATDIGEFTGTGQLVVWHQERIAACLDLAFLHDGVPRKRLEAEWTPPVLSEPTLPVDLDYTDVLERLLGSIHICSREPVIRQYDHEVKGRTIVKPLMGRNASGPQDAAVLLLGFDNSYGVAVSNGIIPRYGDIDPYQMSAGAFDEAVRQIIAVGGRLPDKEGARRKVPFWSVNDNFCVPNSAYDAEANPQGKLRLAKLVRMCEALRDMAIAYAIPLTSGKDSMKNDFYSAAGTISVPPTVLYSVAAGIEDVRCTVTSDFKASGDAIYLLGNTYDELGGSEFYRLLAQVGANVPRIRPEGSAALYRLVSDAIADGWIASCHDLSDGGLAIALCESAIGGDLGAEISLDRLDPSLGDVTCLFSESHSRFLVSVEEHQKSTAESHFGAVAHFLGRVTESGRIVVERDERCLIDGDLASFAEAWTRGLEEYT